MTIKEQDRAIKLFAIIALGIAMVFIMAFQNFATAQTAHVRYHNKLQKERSFEKWSKDQPKTRIKAVKYAIKQSKAVNGTNNQTARLQRKEENLRRRIR